MHKQVENFSTFRKLLIEFVTMLNVDAQILNKWVIKEG